MTGAPNLVLKPGTPIPVISSVNNPIDRMGLNVISRAGLQHRVIFTAADWSAKVSAARVGIGYLIAPRRAVPASLTCAEAAHVPPAPDLPAAIHMRPEDAGDRGLDALVETLAWIFRQACDPGRVRMASA